MERIWVCGCSQAHWARVDEAMREYAEVRHLAGSELDQWLPIVVEPPEMLILGVDEGGDRDPVLLARRVLSRWPRTTIVAYYDEPAAGTRNLSTLAAAGVHDFLFAGLNDRGLMLRNFLEGARRERIAMVVLQTVRAVLPPALHVLAEAALHRPAVVTNLAALATAVEMHLRTVHDRCRRYAGIHPQEFLTLLRLALVAELLGSTGATLERIALELEYASPTALRNSLKRHTGKTASEIRREGGGLELVVRRLERAVAAGRCNGVALQVTVDAEARVQHSTTATSRNAISPAGQPGT